MQSKECHISDIEDNYEEEEEEEEDSEWEENTSYESSSENEEEYFIHGDNHYFDPTKITTSLPLLPFNNQVGGHASFFRFSKRAICKPVSTKEQEFYENIDSQHHELLPFTSQYMGVLNVTYRPSTIKSEPPVPEVLFEKNKHLLRNWKECTINKHYLRRHSSSSSVVDKSKSKKFQEQVLREVFSPKAIKERLLLAENWSKRWNTSQPNLSQSYSTHHDQWNHENPIVEGGRSVPTISTFSAPPTNGSALASSIDHMTLEPRRPTIMNSTSVVNLKSTIDNTSDDIFTMDDIDIGTHKEQQKEDLTTTTNNVLQVDSNCLNHSNSSPWSLQIYNRDLLKLKSDNNNHHIQKFILIEDLTDGVKYPCVLDLKMGTRQYGVYATREKMRSQTIKCDKSTSKVLGVRVCGMQVYKTNTREFIFQDKYYGRTLKPDSFRDTLREYLDNGQGCQIQHIPVIVRKLRRLARIVKTMNDYRFYASSLLMIYDGDFNSKRKIDVRIIDFANCVTSEDVTYHYNQFTYPPRNKSPDNGYLLGLKTLVLCFEWIFKNEGGSLHELHYEGDDVFSDIFESANNEVLSSILV